MASTEWAKRTVLALHALGKRRHGALSRAEEEANVSHSYLRQRRRAGTIDLRKMYALLEALGAHPARFFRQLFPTHEQGYRMYVDVPESPPPEIIARARRRLASTKEGSIPRGHIEGLDASRFEQPEDAIDGTIAALPYVDHSDVALTLGVWASAQRAQANFDDATHALIAGLAIAEERNDFPAQGVLLRRLACVVSDHGDAKGALALATLATDRHAQSGDSASVGRSMVDRGAYLFHLEAYAEAIAIVERALTLLSSTDMLFQVTARQYLSISHNAIGSTTEARRYIQEARSFADGLSITTRTKLIWLEGLIEAQCGESEHGERALEYVVSTFTGIHYGEAALATIDLAEIQLEAKKHRSAFESAHRILPLITLLGVRHPVVRSAELVLLELARQGIEGMSDEIISDLRTLLGGLKREKRAWCSLRTTC